MFGKLEIAISLLDTDTDQNLYVRFREEDYIYPVKIPAGNYSLQGFVFLSHYNSIESEKSFDEGMNISFRVMENVMYYIGDYEARASWTGFGIEISEWEVSEIEDNYSITTLRLTESFPGLSKLDTINTLSRN